MSTLDNKKFPLAEIISFIALVVSVVVACTQHQLVNKQYDILSYIEPHVAFEKDDWSIILKNNSTAPIVLLQMRYPRDESANHRLDCEILNGGKTTKITSPIQHQMTDQYLSFPFELVFMNYNKDLYVIKYGMEYKFSRESRQKVDYARIRRQRSMFLGRLNDEDLCGHFEKFADVYWPR